MSSESRISVPVSESWDTYWQGAHNSAAYSGGGVSHPAFHAFWDNFLQNVQIPQGTLRCIDIASGNGSIVEHLNSIFGNGACEITCLDISQSAISSIEKRFPAVTGIVADAADIPFDSAAFDIVTSQFGVEYAGAGAIGESARLVSSGGQLAFLLHHAGGSIYRECAASLDAIRRTQESNFIPLAIRLFETGFAASRGADRKAYDDAGRALSPAVRALEDIMQTHGEHVGGNAIASLYADVGKIHSSIQQYEPTEVIGWLEQMASEMDAYSGRMSSMCDSAMDEQAFQSVAKTLSGNGLTVKTERSLDDPGTGQPLAWAIVASN
ncbi:MAG: class I SAM-dependent methyltransferase [Gammaproteobacteria bacterium]|nr:class I SAM-dependent methyltransferase [Gammaproteobacteria bacterium]